MLTKQRVKQNIGTVTLVLMMGLPGTAEKAFADTQCGGQYSSFREASGIETPEECKEQARQEAENTSSAGFGPGPATNEDGPWNCENGDCELEESAGTTSSEETGTASNNDIPIGGIGGSTTQETDNTGSAGFGPGPEPNTYCLDNPEASKCGPVDDSISSGVARPGPEPIDDPYGSGVARPGPEPVNDPTVTQAVNTGGFDKPGGSRPSSVNGDDFPTTNVTNNSGQGDDGSDSGISSHDFTNASGGAKQARNGLAKFQDMRKMVGTLGVASSLGKDLSNVDIGNAAKSAATSAATDLAMDTFNQQLSSQLGGMNPGQLTGGALDMQGMQSLAGGLPGGLDMGGLDMGGLGGSLDDIGGSLGGGGLGI